MGRKSQVEAQLTRASITDAAFELGAAEGLEVLSLARIAAHLRLSKSGVAGHFASKQGLQLAAVTRAIADFTKHVWEPHSTEDSGGARLYGVMGSWLAYSRSRHPHGGCFLTAASIEFDDRPGPVRDLLVASWQRWHALLAADAQAAGLDGPTTAFELHAVVTQAMWMQQLLSDDAGWAIAQQQVDRVLDAANS